MQHPTPQAAAPSGPAFVAPAHARPLPTWAAATRTGPAVFPGAFVPLALAPNPFPSGMLALLPRPSAPGRGLPEAVAPVHESPSPPPQPILVQPGPPVLPPGGLDAWPGTMSIIAVPVPSPGYPVAHGVVPEPASVVMLGVGAVLLAGWLEAGRRGWVGGSVRGAGGGKPKD